MAELLARRPPLHDEWDRLADELDASVFLRPGFIDAVLAGCSQAEHWPAVGETAGRGRFELVTERTGPRLEAALPIIRADSHAALATHWEALSHDGLLARDVSMAAGLVHRVIEGGVDQLSLPFIDRSGARVAELVATLGTAGLPLRLRQLPDSLHIDLSSGFDAYHAGLRRSLRKDLRRRLRRLHEAGHVELDVITDEDAAITSLAEIELVEAAGWKGDSGTALQHDVPARAFFREVTRWAARQDALRLHILRLDGRAVAFDLGLVDRGALYMWKTGFDASLRSVAPGKLVLLLGLEDAAASGISRVELMGRPEPYKLAWATGHSEPVVLQVFSRRARGRLRRARIGATAAARRGARRALDGLRATG